MSLGPFKPFANLFQGLHPINLFNSLTSIHSALQTLWNAPGPGLGPGVIGVVAKDDDLLSTGFLGAIDIPWNFTVTGWSMISNSSDTFAIDVCFLPPRDQPPTPPMFPSVFNSITGGKPPQLISQRTASGGIAETANWGTFLTIWGTVMFNLMTVPSSATWVMMKLEGNKS